MIGGHLDSWHAGTGATDNAAGCSVMLETMRTFQKLGIKPRRTIRIALWTGEEEGLLGSRGWVAQHLATKPVDPKEANLPEFMRRQAGPLELKPEHGKVSIYFNVDSGTGKIRGVSLQENQALTPIFREWMEPYADLGMSLITMNNSGGSDFLSFDGVGVPGIDFIQDEVEYESRTHHSNMDVYERIQRDDMLQAVAIVGGFVYQAAQRNEMMPRKPLPQPEPPPATPNPQLETKPDATKKEPK
jgi:Zn-dependent M28 family amino/carboxypeptidase